MIHEACTAETVLVGLPHEVTIMWPICTTLSYGHKDSHWEICPGRLYYRTAQKATKMYHKHVMH